MGFLLNGLVGFSSEMLLLCVETFSLKKSNPEIFSENTEILYLSYAHNEILGIFKFILKNM